jgi:hypothetical protein
MGTPTTRAPRARNASNAPKTRLLDGTASPAPTKTLAARSMPCWQPLVMHHLVRIDGQAALRQEAGDCRSCSVGQAGVALAGRCAFLFQHVDSARRRDSTGRQVERGDARRERNGPGRLARRNRPGAGVGAEAANGGSAASFERSKEVPSAPVAARRRTCRGQPRL